MTGVELIAQERERQVKQEGWTAEHDDSHNENDLIDAAVCYALDTRAKRSREYMRDELTTFIKSFYPWEPKWWKPTPDNPIRQLTKAGALIAAEIDRLQRTPT